VHEQAASTGVVGLGGGLTHTGSRLGEARTQAQVTGGAAAFELPSYTTAKILAYWRINKTVRLSLDIDNVFNKTYYLSSFQRTWVTPGMPRTVTLGVQMKF
jgi:iron complex outermembrane recepter protein